MVANTARIIAGFDWEDSDRIPHHVDMDQSFRILEYLPEDHVYALDVIDNGIHKTAVFLYTQVIPNH